jgi:hypothetical protein
VAHDGTWLFLVATILEQCGASLCDHFILPIEKMVILPARISCVRICVLLMPAMVEQYAAGTMAGAPSLIFRSSD